MRVRQPERGSGPVTAVLVLGILALVFTIGVVAIGAVAREERSAAQHAADAAALAGAEAVRDGLPALLIAGFASVGDLPGMVGAGTCGLRGQVRADELAAANGATLTSYCWNPFEDRISVEIRLNATAEGEPATARATAATRMDLSNCRIDPGFVPPTPTPTPTPTVPSPSPSTPPTPPPSPTPPPPKGTTIDCGFGEIPVLYVPATKLYLFVELDRVLRDVEPRLVS